MRKHTLITLTAFTALGTSAIAGAAGSGTFTASSVLSRSTAVSRQASAAASGHLSVDLTNVRHARPQRITAGGSAALQGHDALVLHDVARQTDVIFVRNDAKSKPKPLVVSAPALVYVPPAVTTTTTVAPVPPPPIGGVWYELRMCESGDNYAENNGNGYYGAYQFSLATWYGLGFTGLPSSASPATQDLAAQELQSRSGWGQWPACSANLGL